MVSVGRPLPLLRAWDASPLSRGLATHSLVDGLTPAECIMNTASSRVGLVVSRLEVPSSGYKQRRIAQCMKDCTIASDGTVRCASNIIQFCYGGDGGDPRADVKTSASSETLDKAAAEAAASGNGELAAAVAVLRRVADPHIPLALDWLIRSAPRSDGRDPRAASAEDGLVCAAALELRPWQPSEVARAHLLVALRASERKRLRLHGSMLKALLDRVVEDWRRSRAPVGMAVGVFVATSVGQPATQNRLNAFYTAGMQGGGSETADEAARALENLLSASDPGVPGMFGMTLHTVDGSREAARNLAVSVCGLTLAAITAGSPEAHASPDTMDGRQRALWGALCVLHGVTGPAATAVVLPLDRGAMQGARLTAPLVEAAVERAVGFPTAVWPFEDAPFLVVAAPNASHAARLATAPKKGKGLCAVMVRGLHRVTRAWVLREDGGAHVVRTAGTDLSAAMGLDTVNGHLTTSTSVRDTLAALGAEAATRAAEREIRRLVGESRVNRRHLSLFADFMMRTGEPLPFSRYGMKSAGVGPLARALYETPMATIAAAAVRGETDDLSSFLTQIFCGSVLRTGTGSFDVLYDGAVGCEEGDG